MDVYDPTKVSELGSERYFICKIVHFWQGAYCDKPKPILELPSNDC